MSEVFSSVQKAFVTGLDTLTEFGTNHTSTTTSVLLCVLTAGAIAYLVKKVVFKDRRRLPPGPRGLPLLGNILSLSGKEQFYKTLLRWAKEKYGPVITIYLGPIRCVTLNSTEVVMEALMERGMDFAGRPQALSLGVMSEGFKDIAMANASPTWRLHRKIASQALKHYMKGQHFEKVVHECVAIIMEKMEEEQAAFDPHPFMSKLMFHIIDMICFGDVKEYGDPTILRLNDIFDAFTNEIGNGFLEDIVPLLHYFPTKKFKSFRNLLNETFAYIYTRIDEHRGTFSKDNIRDIVDSILLAQMEAERDEDPEAMASFTNTHVGQTIGDIFGAGIDTSRTTLDWLLNYAAGFPEEQRRMQKEIDEVTGGRMPSITDRPNLIYTEAFLYEVMRHAPVVPLAIPHQTLCDTKVGGYDVPKGTLVMANLWGVLNDPEVWDSPGTFLPDRFIDAAGKLKAKPESWIPFSAGRRVCLGEAVAKPELLLVFACIMKRFSISLAPGTEFDPMPQNKSMAIHIAKPFKIVATKR